MCHAPPRVALLGLLFCSLALLIGCSGGDFTVASGDGDAAPSDTSVSGDTGSPFVDGSDEDASIEDTLVGDSIGDGSTADARPDAAKTCSGNDGCLPGLCVRRGCETAVGTCVDGGGAATYRPVCGCNGVTYWNATVAAQHSAPIAHDEPCLDVEAMTCGASADSGDGADSICVFTTLCNGVKGTCWRVPTGKVCGENPGPTVRSCKTDGCYSRCDALRDGLTSFYASSCTP